MLLDCPSKIEICLQKESWNEIETAFGKLITSIKKSFMERNIQPNDLLECLEDACSHLDKKLKKGGVLIFEEVREKCEKCETIKDFWAIIRNYYTFYSFKVIKVLAYSEHATKEDKDHFKNYEEHFIVYSQKVVEKFASGFDVTTINGVTEVEVKILEKFEKFTNEHLYEFKINLAYAIGVSPEYMQLINLRPGCTELTYHAPLIVEAAAFPLSTQQEAALRELRVIWLQCGKYFFLEKVRTECAFT